MCCEDVVKGVGLGEGWTCGFLVCGVRRVMMSHFGSGNCELIFVVGNFRQICWD